MNENNILEIFYKMLDDNKFYDIDKFETVENTRKFVDMLYKRYRRISQMIDVTNEPGQTNDLISLKNQWLQVESLRETIDGAFFDIQEYYFVQGFKASMELREQLKRLIDNKSI